MDELKNHFEKLYQEAQKQNVQLEMLVTGNESLSIGYQQKKLEKYESNQSHSAGLRVIDGSSQGYAFTENLSWEALYRTYQEAFQNAQTLKNKSDQEKLPLAKPAKVQNISFPVVQDVSIESKMEVAKQLEELTLKADPKVESVPYSVLKEVTQFKRILNSEGVDLHFKTQFYSGFISGLAKKNKASKTSWESFFARDFNDISVEKLAQIAADRAVSRLDAEKLPTGNYPVVIDREIMPVFISMLVGHLSAQEVIDQVSLLSGKLSQKIASELFSLLDDPFDMREPGVRPFDSEGTPSQKTTLFEAGVLKSYLSNLESARKLGIQNTGNAARSPSTTMAVGPSNLIMAKGTTSRDQMLKSGRVILLTDMNGGLHSGYKESTGDFSLPCEGFLYEDGKLLGPVDQFVVSGNIFEVLQNITAVGDTYNRPGEGISCPDVMIKSLSFAG